MAEGNAGGGSVGNIFLIELGKKRQRGGKRKDQCRLK